MDFDHPRMASVPPRGVSNTSRRPSSEVRPKRQSSNHTRQVPTSPEVISSLIDSLSTIAIPAQNHCDRYPVRTHGLSTASSRRTSNNGVLAPLDTGKHSAGLSERGHSTLDGDRGSDEAAEPPVVKTAKPPSGYSPITAPKPARRDSEGSPRSSSFFVRGSRSTNSLRDDQSKDKEETVDTDLSISDVPIPRHSPASRETAENKRVSRNSRGLMYMSSRERLKTKELERRRTNGLLNPINNSGEPGEHMISPTARSQPLSPIIMIEQENVILEESGGNLSARGSPTPRARSAQRQVSDIESLNVPNRSSSLRGSRSPNRKDQRSSHLSEESVSADDLSKKSGEGADDGEDRVARRIRELKRQKELRNSPDHVAVDSPMQSSNLAVSPISNSEISPVSSDVGASAASETRQDHTAKAHKILGIATNYAIPELRRRPRSLDFSQSSVRSSAIGGYEGNFRPMEDCSPLPINYNLAIETLGQSPISPNFNFNANRPVSSRGSIGGSPGVGTVGGRSALSRRRNSEMIAGPPGRKLSRSQTHRSFSAQAIDTRATLENGGAPYQASIPSSASFRSSSASIPKQKGKRWSQPDLPAAGGKEPKSYRSQRMTDFNATQLIYEPVSEEHTASSRDSVEIAIESYLDAPRFSCRVRHPQTGRVISFSDIGDPNGYAVVCCVGMGLTRYVMGFYDELAQSLRLRLITPERPGICDSQTDPSGTPMTWPDDVSIICQSLKISKYSLLAHSAGAVYALATALRMPNNIRGRVHLLAPWIPPSMMAPLGQSQDAPPTTVLPRSQRLLRVLPASFLRVANSSFLNATSGNLARSLPKAPTKGKRRSLTKEPNARQSGPHNEALITMDQVVFQGSTLDLAASDPTNPNYEAALQFKEALEDAQRERREFEDHLTFGIWGRATARANPATDLAVCLELKHPIGFRYEDVTRGCVIHHGSKDSRVPVDNVRWLGRVMRRCEVRILDGEQHGLMASPHVMSNVLSEIAREWEDWTAACVTGGGDAKAA